MLSYGFRLSTSKPLRLDDAIRYSQLVQHASATVIHAFSRCSRSKWLHWVCILWTLWCIEYYSMYDTRNQDTYLLVGLKQQRRSPAPMRTKNEEPHTRTRACMVNQVRAHTPSCVTMIIRAAINPYVCVQHTPKTHT